MKDGAVPIITQRDGYCFGRPHLVGSGVTVAIIVERFMAGEYVDALALDYDLSPYEIQEALRWAIKHRRRG